MINNNELEKDFIDGYCLETGAEFLVYPGNMLPEEVTELLDLKPTRALRRGQSITNRIGRTHIQPINFWMLSSEEQINSLNLGEHLDWVLNSIISSKEQILLLQKIEGISMRIDCVWYSKGDESGITLTPEQMRKMTALNLQCSFKLCFLMNSPKGSLVNNRVSNCLGYEGDAE